MFANVNSDSPRAVLWDLDGTLIDTSPAHYRCWNMILAPRGLTLTWERFVSIFGQRNDQVVRNFLGADTSDDEVAAVSEAKETLYRALVAGQPPDLLPGVQSWLARLAAAGWRQAVATMTPRRNLEVLLAALDLGPYFVDTVTGDDVLAGKPDPQIFTLAAHRLGVPPDACVVVEDAPAGVEAARRAGMRCIGANPSATLAADIVVPTLADLPADAFDRLVTRSEE
jgi:beta-phosphoglucomutase family hydrolase